MHESLIRLTGDQLDLDDYCADFDQRFWRTDIRNCWKLERQQNFSEPGEQSWEAFRDGEWGRALRLLDEKRSGLRSYHQKVRRQGIELRRVRVIEEPISPYLIWELNSLRVRAESGGRIRVVAASEIMQFEQNGLLPEILVLGNDTVYQVLYDSEGAAYGAIRSLDRAVAKKWTELSAALYEKGEELTEFFARKVAGLTPPGGTESQRTAHHGRYS